MIKTHKIIFIFALIAAFLVLEASPLMAQGPYSILTGTVRGVHFHGLKRWLEVEGHEDKTIVNFRIGHNTRYIPHRYPNVGEKVKVEYLTERNVPVAYSVTILEGGK